MYIKAFVEFMLWTSFTSLFINSWSGLVWGSWENCVISVYRAGTIYPLCLVAGPHQRALWDYNSVSFPCPGANLINQAPVWERKEGGHAESQHLPESCRTVLWLVGWPIGIISQHCVCAICVGLNPPHTYTLSEWLLESQRDKGSRKDLIRRCERDGVRDKMGESIGSEVD